MLESDNGGWDELRWAGVLRGKCHFDGSNNPFEDSLVLSSERLEPDPRYEKAPWPFRDDKTWEGDDPVSVLELRRYVEAAQCRRDPFVIPAQELWYNKQDGEYEFSLWEIGQIVMAYSRSRYWRGTLRKFLLLNKNVIIPRFSTLPTSFCGVWNRGLHSRSRMREPDLLEIGADDLDLLTLRDASVSYKRPTLSVLHDRIRNWF